MLFQIIRKSPISIEDRIKKENWAQEKANILAETEIKNSENIIENMRKEISKINNENSDHMSCLQQIKEYLLDFDGGLNKLEAITLFRKLFIISLPQEKIKMGMTRRSSMGDMKNEINVKNNVRTCELINQYGQKNQPNFFSLSTLTSLSHSSPLPHQSQSKNTLIEKLPQISIFPDLNNSTLKSSICEKSEMKLNGENARKNRKEKEHKTHHKSDGDGGHENKNKNKDENDNDNENDNNNEDENDNENNSENDNENDNENKNKNKNENENNNKNENENENESHVNTEDIKNIHHLSKQHTHSHSTRSFPGFY